MMLILLGYLILVTNGMEGPHRIKRKNQALEAEGSLEIYLVLKEDELKI